MALEGYKSNHNVVYSSKYNCVWTPKYRRSVLVGPMAKRCEPVIRQTAKEHRAEIIALEIMPDHVQVLVEVDPQFGIHRLVKHLKEITATHPYGRIAISYHGGRGTPGGHQAIC